MGNVPINVPFILIVLVGIVAYRTATHPPEFRRGPVVSTMAYMKQVDRYSPVYIHCEEPEQNGVVTLHHMTDSYIIGRRNVFPARSDEDAIAFANAARPDCQIAMMTRIETQYFGVSPFDPENEFTVDLP